MDTGYGYRNHSRIHRRNPTHRHRVRFLYCSYRGLGDGGPLVKRSSGAEYGTSSMDIGLSVFGLMEGSSKNHVGTTRAKVRCASAVRARDVIPPRQRRGAHADRPDGLRHFDPCERLPHRSGVTPRSLLGQMLDTYKPVPCLADTNQFVERRPGSG